MPGALSQYRAQQPIGMVAFMADHGFKVTLDDRSVWLRAGAFVPAAESPRGSKLRHLKAHSFGSSAGTFSSAQGFVATDGSGTFLLSDGVGSVLRSTDGGATFNAVSLPATPSGVNYQRVKFAGGKFWALGATSTVAFAAESTTGATGTWTLRLVDTGGSQFSNSGDIDWTGTNFVAAFSHNGAGSGIYTSPTGAAWTYRAATTSGDPLLEVCAAQTSGWVVVCTASGNIKASSDHGVNWTPFYVLATPIAANARVKVAGNRFWFVGLTGTVFYSATAPSQASDWGISFTTPFFLPNANDAGWALAYTTLDKSRIYWPNDQFQLCCIDSTGDVFSQSLIIPGRVGASSRGRLAVEGDFMVMAQPGSGASLVSWAQSSDAAPNAVGIRNSSATSGVYAYVRIK